MKKKKLHGYLTLLLVVLIIKKIYISGKIKVYRFMQFKAALIHNLEQLTYKLNRIKSTIVS